MNEEQLAAIHADIAKSEDKARHVFVRIRDARSPGNVAVDTQEAFPRLVSIARTALAALPGPQPEDDEIALATAICWVGPVYRPPPFALFDEANILRQAYGITSDERAVELAVAFGLGRGRGAPPAGGRVAGTWNGVWDGAYTALLRLVRAHCVRVHRHFASQGVLGYPFAADQAGLARAAWQDAQLIVAALLRPISPPRPLDEGEEIRISGSSVIASETASALLRIGDASFHIPVGARQVLQLRINELELTRSQGNPLLWPQGGRLVVLSTGCEVRVDSPDSLISPKYVKLRWDQWCRASGPAELTFWSCTCGTRDCAQEHRLASWDPHENGLSHFVGRSVAGWAFWARNPRLPTNVFVRGMLAAVLARDGFGDSGLWQPPADPSPAGRRGTPVEKDQPATELTRPIERPKTDLGIAGTGYLRLRVFNIEYRRCPICDTKEKVWSYPRTIRCKYGHLLPDATPRRTEPMLGIEGDQRGWFLAAERCVCPKCRGLYALSPQTLSEASQELPSEEKADSDNPSADETDRNTPSDSECGAPLLQRARDIAKRRRKAGLKEFVWCPHCRHGSEDEVMGTLPERATWVDIPIHATMEYLDQVQDDNDEVPVANADEREVGSPEDVVSLLQEIEQENEHKEKSGPDDSTDGGRHV